MSQRFSIEVTTGVITRYIDNAKVDASIASLLTAGDIIKCAVEFTSNGDDVTPDILPDGAQLLIGLRSTAGRGDLLAQSTPHTMVSGWAETTLSLNTAEIAALVAAMPASTRTVRVLLEVEVTAPAGVSRETVAQQRFNLRAEVNSSDDSSPESIVESRLADMLDADPALTANSDEKISTQAAVKQFVADYVAANSLVWVAAPAALDAAGTAGQMAYDGAYLYICYAANAWMKFVGVR